MRGRLARLLLAAALALLPAAVQAHDSRPVLVSIAQQGGDLYLARVVTPPSVPIFDVPSARLPDGCLRAGGQASARPAYSVQALYRCTDGLGGGTVTLKYPEFNPSLSTMLRVSWLSGETRTVVSPPETLSIGIPDPETATGVAGQYFMLGVHHILSGVDHLLFLACLLLIAGTGRRILIVVTGFTVAHSITLALAALRLVHVPVPPVEAAIALSIVFLPTEIARPRRDTLTWRYPVAVSGSFGFLHGFGFAAALGETGMPQTEVPTALLFFNVGVEAGQLMFIGALIVAMLAVTRALGRERLAPDRLLPRVERPAAYVVGSLAAFWMVERLWAFVPVS
ncbi:MAG: HupE/UreJ family protein [Alphaproteobacteria bacterium]|nr:HupE/UreJ family protein [Alphaproteobacteria bacterium]